MDIIIANSSERTIYEQIYLQIKGAIIGGRLAEGEILPSLRILARDLRVSVVSTKRAYDELERDGFIKSVPGKGYFVAKNNAGVVREEYLKKIEGFLTEAVETGGLIGLGIGELKEMLELIFTEVRGG